MNTPKTHAPLGRTTPGQSRVRLASAEMSTARPEDLTIPGIDFEIDKTHPLFAPRIAQLKAKGRSALADLITAFKESPVLLHPLICRLNRKTVEVGIGRRRALAARAYNEWAAANGREPMRVTLIIRAWSDAAWQKAIAAENLARKADDVLAEVEHLAHLVDVCGSEKIAAHCVGMRHETFQRVLRVHAMPDAVKALVQEHAVERDVAVIVASLPFEEQEPQLRRMIETRDLTAARAREALIESDAKDADDKPARPARPKGPAVPPRPVVVHMAEEFKTLIAAGKPLPVKREVADTIIALMGLDPDALGRVTGLPTAFLDARESLQKKRQAAREAAHKEEGEA